MRQLVFSLMQLVKVPDPITERHEINVERNEIYFASARKDVSERAQNGLEKAIFY